MEQKETTILQIGFGKLNKIPTIIEGSGVGIATGHQAPFQGPASNHRAEDGGL